MVIKNEKVNQFKNKIQNCKLQLIITISLFFSENVNAVQYQNSLVLRPWLDCEFKSENDGLFAPKQKMYDEERNCHFEKDWFPETPPDEKTKNVR